MNMLRDDLACFAQAIQGHGTLSQGMVTRPGHSLASALDIYRNNYRGNLQDTLAAAYPVIVKIVGEEFFRMMAREFIQLHPSRSGNLHLYGMEFAEFVAAYAPAQSLAYLGDVAMLEWACHRAYFEPDADALDMARLAQIEPEQYAHLRLLLHPACRIVHARYPIAAIWRAHQPGMPSDFHIDLDSGPRGVLVYRKDDVIQVDELTAADADWLQRIQADVALGEAVAATTERYPEFDLPSALLHLVTQGLLIDFELMQAWEEA